jgi:hypothetical protein
MKISMPRWMRIALAVGALGALPALAEAHMIGGSGAWTDELVCLIPTGVMLVAVIVLARPTKPSAGKPADEPRKDET